jgi:hypothetical protein
VLKASPPAALEVAQSDLLPEFEIIVLDPPAELDHPLEPDVSRQKWRASSDRPLDQQPLSAASSPRPPDCGAGRTRW